jgi:hypothetical protein
MSNKPILPNAYVDINNRNLGLSPASPSGVFAFIGYAEGGSATKGAIVSVSSPNDVKALIGYGELADDLLNFFNNGGKKAYVVPVAIDTVSTLSAVTKTGVGSSTGTITVAAVSGLKVTNIFSVKVEIEKSGTLGVGKFSYSTDAGENKSPILLIPSGATYAIPGTNIELTFVPGGGAVYFEDGDLHAFTATKPQPAESDINTAIDTLVDSDYTFDAIAISADSDAGQFAGFKTKASNAEAKPNFRYIYIIARPVLSSSAANAITTAATIMAAVASDRVQVVTGEMIISRSNHADQAARNVLGIIAGRRSALSLQNDLGKFSAGQLSDALEFRSGWTDTTLEDLDGLRTVTVRKFKSVAGFYPTNGHLSDPFSDVKKDAWRLVLDKASRIGRVAGLGFLKMDVNPEKVEGSTSHLKNTIQNQLDTFLVGNDEAVSVSVEIPGDQNILLTEEIKVDIGVMPFGHASYIGITIALVNPLTAA